MEMPEPSSQRENLADLQSASLKVIAAFTGLTGYLWLVPLLWPRTGAHAPPVAWAGSILLILSASLSFGLRARSFGLASHLLVWGSSAGVACALLAYRWPELACLFALPAVFASALLSREMVFVLEGLANLLFAALVLSLLGPSLSPLARWLPVAVIGLITAGTWISARNLHIALAWVWSGYKQAHQNERLAREQQAELRRALKALDEATYRLERANYMLTLARDQAEEARRLKQEFAQTISHELRTPLNLIVGFTELMTGIPEYYGAPLPAPYARDLTIVHRNACHLQTLVSDVLDLARIEAAQMAILPEETAPGGLVEEAVNTARSLVESRGLALHTEIEPDLPRLWLDPTRIRQVLFNLLNNAARFTERGAITVGVRRRDEQVLFTVADTGVGIAPENLPRIFQEFQQLDGTMRRRHEGAGLGLAISRRFVELHGGRIWAESQVGTGSAFHFSLPTRRADPIAGPGSSGPELASAAPAGPGEERILLAVTPSPSAATLLSRYVRGCRTVVAHDLEQARHLAPQLMPQAVLVDAACERLDPAALQQLALAWGLSRTPFMACPLPGEEPLHERLAVDGYLVKPVSRQGLWDVLRPFGEKVDRVLVIDDDRDFVRLLGRMLDSPVRRYQVLRAYSAQEGLAMLQARQPDLVFVDLGLPDVDGFRLIEQVRANPLWREIPIVVVSARDEMSGRAMDGALLVAKGNGLLQGEVVQWVQSVLDTTTRQQRP